MLRELVAVYEGNELLLGLALGTWLAWTAAGSWLLARWRPLRRLSQRDVVLLLPLAAGVLVGQMTLTRVLPTLLKLPAGSVAGLPHIVAGLHIGLAPFCLLSGALFSLAAATSDVQAYTWEAAGATAGGAMFAFLLNHVFGPYQIALLVLASDIALALAARRATRVSGGALTLLVALPLTIGALVLGPALHRATLHAQWPDMVFAGDSPYGRLIILRRASQRVFIHNGAPAFETQSTSPEEIVHPALLAHPDPAQVLLIGGGVAGDLREALKHPIKAVTYVELDSLLVEAAARFLPPEQARTLQDPRVRLRLDDGRRFLHEVSTAVTYDVIIVDLPEPTTGALNRFYTREFFEQAAQALNPGGVLALSLPSAENYWSPELTARNGSIYRALRDAFDNVLILPSEQLLMLASDRPLPENAEVYEARFTERNLETQWITPAALIHRLTSDRRETAYTALATAEGPENRDMRPISYLHTLALWLRRIQPGLGARLAAMPRSAVALLSLPLLGILALARARRAWAAPVVVACSGWVEMTLETTILLAYQVWHGTAYGRVSAIVTGFMLGLALGAAVASRGHSRQPALWRRLLWLQAATAVYALLLTLAFALAPSLPEAVFPPLAAIAGTLTGATFAWAMRWQRGQGERTNTLGLLYAADLLGGCAGALVCATLLTPLLGIPTTCALAAAAALTGTLALL